MSLKTTTQRPNHSRTPSLADVSSTTQALTRSVGLDESLRSYKLLEALRQGEIQAIDKLLLPAHVDQDDIHERSSTVSSNTIDQLRPLVLAVQCAETGVVEYVMKRPDIDINSRDVHGNTSLHLAALHGRADVVDMLLARPDINDTIQNNDRKQAFQLAASADLANSMQIKRGAYIEKVNQQFAQALKAKDDGLTDLLDNPRASTLLDLNKTDVDGNTALHIAAVNRDASLVSLLLNHGADAFPRNKKGKLPTDLSKDDKIRALFKNIPQRTMLNSSPTDPIRYSGHLKKWTNYKSGYKARWFVLENGVLSYYRNPDESENACRGSINLRVAKIVYQHGDRTKFEILGPDKNGFHVKAAHPTEAKNWIWNLNQAKTQARDAGKDQVPRDLTGAPLAKTDAMPLDILGKSGPPNTGGMSSYTPSLSGSIMEKPSALPAMDELSQHAEHSVYAYSDAGSEIDDFDNNMTEEPHQDIFGITANTAKVQLEMMDQICDSILTDSSTNNPTSHQIQDAAQTFRSSTTSLRGLLSQLVLMASDRERFWRSSVEREREVRQLWEENMHALVTDQDELERKVYEANMERKSTKKALRQARNDLHAKGNTPIGTPALSTADLSQSILASATISPMADSDSSDDEFFDANANESMLNVSRLPPSQDQKIVVSEESVKQTKETPVTSMESVMSKSVPVATTSSEADLDSEPMTKQKQQPDKRIASSFRGYENGIRSDMGRVDDRPSVSLWGILKSMIGKDMTKMTLPVSFNEATSLLQRVAEDMEYTDSLDRASHSSDPSERALLVAAFAASEYASTIDRVAKPFNPLLHETYEYCRPDKGFRFVVEQVSHHPPIGAAHAESLNWEYYGESSVKSKFTGKSFDINPLGTWYLKLKLANGDTELYTWKKVNTAVVGILLGSPTVDNYGPMIVTNNTNKIEARLDFKARGWRGADAYKVTGSVVDGTGAERWIINGKWNDKLFARRAGEKGESTVIWSSNPRKKDVPFNLTTFAMSLNALDDKLQPWLPPTDTRLRPDQRAMEEGKYDFAATEKNRLEEKQRATRRDREKQGLEHGARWFKQARHPVTNEAYWAFTGEYWDVRDQAGSTGASWSGVEDIF